ncbi:hypothetical protein [Salmonella phage BIS20]|uniref:hypothetical protein n=1 Tax=Salmonella phage BIS20 TaxID=2861008 RepID=UPI0023294336|nr:hypothetical protein PQA63_gp01 [Salmonella phage BIS20]QYC52660.1 hypothetical protein [Salmonella phage BIS20]
MGFLADKADNRTVVELQVVAVARQTDADARRKVIHVHQRHARMLNGVSKPDLIIACCQRIEQRLTAKELRCANLARFGDAAVDTEFPDTQPCCLIVKAVIVQNIGHCLNLAL